MGTKINTYKASLRRLMDRALTTHEEAVEDALVKAATNPKSVLPSLELWGRVRREIGPASADDSQGLVNVTVILGTGESTESDAALPAGRLTLHLPGGNGASE